MSLFVGAPLLWLQVFYHLVWSNHNRIVHLAIVFVRCGCCRHKDWASIEPEFACSIAGLLLPSTSSLANLVLQYPWRVILLMKPIWVAEIHVYQGKHKMYIKYLQIFLHYLWAVFPQRIGFLGYLNKCKLHSILVRLTLT